MTRLLVADADDVSLPSGDACPLERAVSEAGNVRRDWNHLRLDQARRTLVYRTHQRPQQPGNGPHATHRSPDGLGSPVSPEFSSSTSVSLTLWLGAMKSIRPVKIER